MGGAAKRHVSSLCDIKCYRSKVQKHRMHILLALLYVSIVAAPGCSSLPTKGDSIRNTIHSIMNIVQITLVHIKKLRTKLPVAPQIELSTPSIEGLTSISHDLGLLDNELQSPFTELLSQIQADVSSLEGRVRSLAITMECPIQARPGGHISNNSFPDSHLYQTLTKVQRYLEKFLLSKDKLKVC
ncbi:leptin-B-like [Micropterus salmoides]|uniref:leptin-B-like n=1 Tax=Micropterus salmoides TaxID=27706 RepID=UPI0018EBF845|nr:leptin-B-like [Micropterus salmoides]